MAMNTLQKARGTLRKVLQYGTSSVIIHYAKQALTQELWNETGHNYEHLTSVELVQLAGDVINGSHENHTQTPL